MSKSLREVWYIDSVEMNFLMIHGKLISNPEFKEGFNNWQIETSLEERQYTLGKAAKECQGDSRTKDTYSSGVCKDKEIFTRCNLI